MANLDIGIAERQAQAGQRVRILVVAANPLKTQPLRLDEEVKEIQEALRRSRQRDNFQVNMRLAATPKDLRRALLDLEPQILHFSGHGAGAEGLVFVSDASAGAIYRSADGAVQSRSTAGDGVRYVNATTLANLLRLCDDHLECVVLNACYSDVQAEAIAAHVPYTIGMGDAVGDQAARQFSEGFYDAIGAGKSYEKAFEWGRVAIELDLADPAAALLPILKTQATRSSVPAAPVPNRPTSESELPQDTQSAEDVFDCGDAKQNKGDYRGAIADYTEAIRLKPDYIHAYAGRGLAFQELGEKEIAQKDLEYALLLPARTPDDYLGRGSAKFGLGDKEGAIADYTEAIRLKPDLALAYNNRGAAKAELEDKESAIADINEAIRLQPDLALAYNVRGYVKAVLEDNEGAIADYNEAIRLQPDLAIAYNGRGAAKVDLGDKEGAIADFNKTIHLQPDLAFAYFYRGAAKADLGDKKGAIADYNEAIRLQPDLALAYNNRGLTKADLGDNKGAIADYNEAIRLQPDDALAYNNRGAEKADLGDNKGAIADYDEAIRLQADLAIAYFHRGLAKADLGDKKGAIADYSETIRLQPDYALAYNNRGVAKADLEDKGGALSDYRTAARLFRQQGDEENYCTVQDNIRALDSWISQLVAIFQGERRG